MTNPLPAPKLLLLLLLLLLSSCCSHDRAFMERCCGRVLELDHGGFNTTHPFGGEGSYDAFKEVRLKEQNG
jgi:ATPase subunit of ABC transporter with duplicated ATPase domains